MDLLLENDQFTDGGEISIDWADDPMSRKLPEDAPILAILHTITGKLRDDPSMSPVVG